MSGAVFHHFRKVSCVRCYNYVEVLISWLFVIDFYDLLKCYLYDNRWEVSWLLSLSEENDCCCEE